MATITSLPTSGVTELPKRPPPSPRGMAAAAVGLALMVASIWSLIELRINIASILDSLDNAVDFVGRMFPLDFPPLAESTALIGETLAIVFLATLLSVILSLPVAVLAAHLTTTGVVARGSARALIVVMRAIPDLILAIVFFRMFGLGALPGILAMGLHSIGMVAKLYADAIESLPRGPMDAIAAAGGSRWQQIVSGILPPLMPQLIATALHRFDINLRTSVILGYVGVGGIGLAIADAMRTLDYRRGMALALMVLVLCIAVEMLSGMIRAALMRRGATEGWLTRLWNVDETPAGHTLPPWNPTRVQRFVAQGAVLVLVLVSMIAAPTDPAAVVDGLLRMPQTLDLFLPPSGGGVMDSLLEAMLVTVQIALAATFLGCVLAIPIGVLAARNVMRNPWIHQTFRVIIVIIRGIPELILAIIFVVITGLGGVAGTLALAVGAVGMLSKLVADSLEETDTDVQQALRANGANRWQVFFSATLRQAAPAFVAHILYLLDSNIRAATLLGIVGAGGVGFILLNATRVQQFDVVTTVLLMILAVVLAVEALALWLRRSVE